VRRLVLCSGKIYVDLVASDLFAQHPEVGIARVEQLAPFPQPELEDLLSKYPALDEVLWVQEEPENMGAWNFAHPYLEAALKGRILLRLVSRPRSASPAEGSSNIHIYNQRRLVEQAFEGKERAGNGASPQRRAAGDARRVKEREANKQVASKQPKGTDDVD
jgi:2-oxoglutarate dehydrogenase E1 component